MLAETVIDLMEGGFRAFAVVNGSLLNRPLPRLASQLLLVEKATQSLPIQSLLQLSLPSRKKLEAFSKLPEAF